MLRSLPVRHIYTMTRSADQIVHALFARSELPPLEPGTKVYDQSLTKDIKSLKEDKFVIAGKLVRGLLDVLKVEA
jgi:hypothetical protein